MWRGLLVLGLVVSLLLRAAPTDAAECLECKKATGTLVDGAGRALGTVQLEQVSRGIIVRIAAKGLPVGTHGLHLHEVGRCDGPDFMSAGAHFNPTNARHGAENDAGPHAGDLPNLVAGADGSATYTVTTMAVTLTAGPANLLDANGTAVIIHTNADDNRTDPTGNSGGRIACAVLTEAATMPGLPNTGAGGLATSGLVAGGALLALPLLLLYFRRRWSD